MVMCARVRGALLLKSLCSMSILIPKNCIRLHLELEKLPSIEYERSRPSSLLKTNQNKISLKAHDLQLATRCIITADAQTMVHRYFRLLFLCPIFPEAREDRLVQNV